MTEIFEERPAYILSEGVLKCCYYADKEKGGEKGKKNDMVPCHITERSSEQKEMVLSFLLHLLPPVLLCEVQEGFNEVMVWGGFFYPLINSNVVVHVKVNVKRINLQKSQFSLSIVIHVTCFCFREKKKEKKKATFMVCQVH